MKTAARFKYTIKISSTRRVDLQIFGIFWKITPKRQGWVYGYVQLLPASLRCTTFYFKKRTPDRRARL
jgi:hypothetical protein